MIIPPVHTTNPLILESLVKESLFVSRGLNLPFVAEAATVHFGSVLFKSSLVIGTWLWLSLLITIMQYSQRKEVRLPLLIFIFYFLFLMKMPRAQTFYMIPLLPILAIFAADQFFRLYTKKHLYAVVIGSVAICSLIIDKLLCYPDYNLNGFQWLGARYLVGRSTIGSRSIVQTASDGIEQILKWANSNIPRGKTVVTYIKSPHIIRAVCPKPKFRIINGLGKSKSIFMDADYVLISINAEIRLGEGDDNPTGNVYKYLYDVKLLKANFTKMFSVKRAFNIEIASVWRKLD